MKYTKDLPKTVGWYWMKEATPDWLTKKRESQIVFVRDYAGELAVVNQRLEDMAETGREWAGPIPEPEAGDDGARYVVMANRSASSVCGEGYLPCKRNGKVEVFDSIREAEIQRDVNNTNNQSPNVHYSVTPWWEDSK